MATRQIILDTETTGLEPRLGHRIIEVAGVEMINRRLTGRHFHRYLNPGRDSDEGALQVHGLTTEFLSDKPKFAEIVDELLEYITGAELIIHNAPFDIGFLDAELALVRKKKLVTFCPVVIDTLRMAKDLHPGKRNGLDSLCERYQIDNSARTLHGALLDAELLGSECCMLRAACWMLDAACWMLGAECCRLHAGCSMLNAAWLMLGAQCCLLSPGCWMLDAECCNSSPAG